MKLYVYVYNTKNNSINSFNINVEFREKTKFGPSYIVSDEDESKIRIIPFPYGKPFIGRELINKPVLRSLEKYCALYTRPDTSRFVNSVIGEIKNDIDAKKNNLAFLLAFNT